MGSASTPSSCKNATCAIEGDGFVLNNTSATYEGRIELVPSLRPRRLILNTPAFGGIVYTIGIGPIFAMRGGTKHVGNNEEQ